MIFTLALFSTLLASTRAFTSRPVAATPSGPSFLTTTTTRLASSGPMMPYDDDDRMRFYALGTNLAVQANQGNFKSLLAEEEVDIVLEAFEAHFRGVAATRYDVPAILATYGPQLNAFLQERADRVTDRTKKEGEAYAAAFLAEVPEAIRTGSGLVYHETTVGTGASPRMESTVEVHYVGTLIDGTVIDSSVARGETMTVELGAVTEGWKEGLQLMKEGGKATLVIPSDLAYGDGGSGEVIPPGATIQFEIELVKVSPIGGETEELELPDGTVLTVPKGVKMRMVEDE